MAMSILKYFKCTKSDSASSSSSALPDPEGPLISSIPPVAIANVNKKVRERIDDGKKPCRGPYLRPEIINRGIGNGDITPLAVYRGQSMYVGAITRLKSVKQGLKLVKV